MSDESGVDSGTGDDPAVATGLWLVLFRRINGLVHWVAGAAVTVLMLWTVADVIGRRFFNRPLRGTVELTELAMVVIIYLGFAYAENMGDHVSVDLLYSRLRRFAQLLVTFFASCCGILIVGLLTYHLAGYAQVLASGGRVTPTRNVPLGPIAWLGVTGAGLFAVALLDSAVVGVRRFREHS